MTDKEFDQLLKGKLEDYQPDFDKASWEELENRIENEVVSEAVDPFDNAVKAALGQFAVSDSDGNWEEMERRIIEDENASFDHEVRENVENYKAPYDAGSWPVLDEKIAADERFRRRLLGAKILEIAAILIALITFYNVFPDIKNSLFDQKSGLSSEENMLTEQSAKYFTSSSIGNEAMTGDIAQASKTVPSDKHLTSIALSQAPVSGEMYPERNSAKTSRNTLDDAPDDTSDDAPVMRENIAVVSLDNSGLDGRQVEVEYQTAEVDGKSASPISPSVSTNSNSIESVTYVEVLGLPNQLDDNVAMALPEIKLTHKKKSLRFSIGASMDLNALYMPEENFYADGQQITFSEKNLLATGYSAGVGLLFGGGAWSFETGLYYSAKKYEPNRVIQIGKTFDVRTLDFSEISLHIVSVPMYAHWNFDRKGKTRFYAIGGANVNLIANAHYDLITRNNFRSGPSGGVRDKNTDFEVARIREHILDGAEFSSKSYITLVAGLGVEHNIGDKLSVFAQPSFNYQVPFFQFSDQNGKQFKYISMQFGTRVRLR
ncbi:MAG: hypothetical protein DRI69_10580 [Bacteroidetes bacterium]|nr:MAG: hypothetical protein DRI69_10580 [Bacteroidota bacterium]